MEVVTHKCDMCGVESEFAFRKEIRIGRMATGNIPIWFVLAWNGDRCNNCLKPSLFNFLGELKNYINTYM